MCFRASFEPFWVISNVWRWITISLRDPRIFTHNFKSRENHVCYFENLGTFKAWKCVIWRHRFPLAFFALKIISKSTCQISNLLVITNVRMWNNIHLLRPRPSFQFVRPQSSFWLFYLETWSMLSPLRPSFSLIFFWAITGWFGMMMDNMVDGKAGSFSKARVIGSDDSKMGMKGGPVHQ